MRYQTVAMLDENERLQKAIYQVPCLIQQKIREIERKMRDPIHDPPCVSKCSSSQCCTMKDVLKTSNMAHFQCFIHS